MGGKGLFEHLTAEKRKGGVDRRKREGLERRKLSRCGLHIFH